MRSSCSRSSGVNASPKSSASKIWRISISTGRSSGWGTLHPLDRLFQRLAPPDPEPGHQLPGLGERAFDDERSLPEKRTRAPFELGCRPSPASMMPALTSSSLNLPMSASNSGSASRPPQTRRRLDEHHESHGWSSFRSVHHGDHGAHGQSAGCTAETRRSRRMTNGDGLLFLSALRDSAVNSLLLLRTP